jgi:uncharacterized membrane protein YfcA
MTGAEAATGEIGLAAYALIAACAFIGATIAAMSGTGSSLLLAPVLVPLIGVKALLPVISVGSLIGNIARVWVYRGWVDWRSFVLIAVPCVPGVVIGVLIYDWMPQLTLLSVVGVFMILSVPIRRWADRLEMRPSKPGIVAGGFGTGIISGALPSGGIVLVAMLMGMGLRGGAVLGTDAMISILTNITRVSGFGAVDLLDTQLLIIGLLCGAVQIPAAYIARFLITRMGIKLHTVILDCVVILTGLYFVAQALHTWLTG